MQSKLNVGCGRNIMDGDWLNLDHAALPGVQIVYDLERCATVPLPLADDSMDEFLLSHVIEHLHATLPLMQELHRVAKPNAKAVIRVPYGSSDDAWEDPTHVRGYFRGSFGYFSQPFYWRADYGYRGDWQVEKLIFRVEKQVYAGQNVNSIMDDVTTKRNVVKEMIAEMRAIKPIREPLLALQTQMPIEIFLS